MEYRENPMFGRKVFFLNPPLSIENYVVESLKEDEFEVYVINDITYAKPTLRLYENAICFIYIDDSISLKGWYNFIKSFDDDMNLTSIFLGVLSAKTKPEDQEKFIMDLKLPGGFVDLNKKLDKLYEQIKGILEINGARGVRKCLRLDLKDNKDVNGYFANGSMLYSFKLNDISALGFAAECPVNMMPLFKPGAVINNVSITMERYSFVSSVVVFKCFAKDNVCTVVCLFGKDATSLVRKKIHNFIFDVFDRGYKKTLSDIVLDLVNYESIKFDKKNEEAAATEADVGDAASLVSSFEPSSDDGELLDLAAPDSENQS